jgi:hypothetical protein
MSGVRQFFGLNSMVKVPPAEVARNRLSRLWHPGIDSDVSYAGQRIGVLQVKHSLASFPHL